MRDLRMASSMFFKFAKRYCIESILVEKLIYINFYIQKIFFWVKKWIKKKVETLCLADQRFLFAKTYKIALYLKAQIPGNLVAIIPPTTHVK